jgi:hypothetical protein
MAAKLKTEQGQAACRERKWIAEPPNGWTKSLGWWKEVPQGLDFDIGLGGARRRRRSPLPKGRCVAAT